MSPRQRQVYAFIANALAETGISPSTAQIAAHIGTCRGRATAIVGELAAAGHVRRTGQGRATRTLETVPIAGRGLRVEEIAWCHANPQRVRGMMAVAGVLVRPIEPAQVGVPDPGPSLEAATKAGRQALDNLWPGDAVEIALPIDPADRKRAYRRLSMMATRRLGAGGALREMSQTSVRITALDAIA